MNHSPAFQLYVNDWLSSTKISTMTPAEEGAYIRLLCYCWNSPDCTIPDDDGVLAILSRLGAEWKGSSVNLRDCFVPHAKKIGRLFNVRLMEERKKQMAWRKKCRAGGIRSGKSRALKAEPSETLFQGYLKGSSRVVELKANSSSSSSSSIKNKTLCGAFETFWQAYPKKKSKGQAERVWEKLQPDEALLSLMLQKVEQASQTNEWKKDSGKFIPHPATWLNAKGWEDEVTRPRTERIPL